MVVVIKKDSDLNEIKQLLAECNVTKKFDAKHFCGLLKTDEDGLKIQQRLRNEWK